MEENFKTTTGFKSYVNKPEITALSPLYLVKGSKNVLIDYANRIISRNGYILYGNAGTLTTGITSSYDWKTSTKHFYPLRVYASTIQFFWNNSWITLKSNLSNSYLEFAKVWDNTEKIDMLLWVLGESNFYKWSGGVAKVASSTATTLTKQGVLSNKTTIAFVAGTPGTVAPTITDSANGFITAGFQTGDTLYVTGSTLNNRNYTIGSVTAGTITLVMNNILTSELVGPSITLHTGEPTWASSRFLTTGTKKINYNGTEYAYTGGETTDTLTGLTAFPTVTTGEYVFQTVIAIAQPSPAIPNNFKSDHIGVQLNQVILASSQSLEQYGSKADDYTNFTLTSPRVPGDPFKTTMSSFCTCIIPIDNPSQNTSSIMFGAGDDQFFQFSYQLAQDNLSELVRMVPLKTATGSGLIASGAIGNIKNAVAYVSREPVLDLISNLEKINDTPISDLIKNDFDTYNFANAHLKYWKRSVYIALPAEGIVLIYDLMRKLWQPPQYIPVSRFAIIDDWLYGHSSVSNETYKLFIGTNDNGVFIPQVARFAYNNGGRRDRYKNMSEFWTDGYITPNALLNLNVNYGFDGILGIKNLPINGGDSTITNSISGSPLGDSPLGTNPLGGDTLDPVASLPGTNATMVRFWQVDTVSFVDYTEYFTEYSMNTLDGQFALVSYGSNQSDAGTSIISHKK